MSLPRQNKLTIPVSSFDASFPGQDIAATATVESVVLPAGFYKLASVNTPLRFRIGSVAVSTVTGSYLAPEDTEVINVPQSSVTADRTLSIIRDPVGSTDGRANVVRTKLAIYPDIDPSLLTS